MIDYRKKGMCSRLRDLFKFWEISDNISEFIELRYYVPPAVLGSI